MSGCQRNILRGSSMMMIALSLAISCSSIRMTGGFVVRPPSSCTAFSTRRQENNLYPRILRLKDVLEEGDAGEAAPPPVQLEGMEKAWRYAKKPLLRIGSKGATVTHGNSLRQLLDAHTAVKVKINTHKLGSLPGAFDVLKQLTVESGGSEDIELLQYRDLENTILVGLPGTTDRVRSGDFPPPPPPPRPPKVDQKQE